MPKYFRRYSYLFTVACNVHGCGATLVDLNTQRNCKFLCQEQLKDPRFIYFLILLQMGMQKYSLKFSTVCLHPSPAQKRHLLRNFYFKIDDRLDLQ